MDDEYRMVKNGVDTPVAIQITGGAYSYAVYMVKEVEGKKSIQWLGDFATLTNAKIYAQAHHRLPESATQSI
jgi:hypothetical protein